MFLRNNIAALDAAPLCHRLAVRTLQRRDVSNSSLGLGLGIAIPIFIVICLLYLVHWRHLKRLDKEAKADDDYGPDFGIYYDAGDKSIPKGNWKKKKWMFVPSHSQLESSNSSEALSSAPLEKQNSVTTRESVQQILAENCWDQDTYSPYLPTGFDGSHNTSQLSLNLSIQSMAKTLDEGPYRLSTFASSTNLESVSTYSYRGLHSPPLAHLHDSNADKWRRNRKVSKCSSSNCLSLPELEANVDTQEKNSMDATSSKSSASYKIEPHQPVSSQAINETESVSAGPISAIVSSSSVKSLKETDITLMALEKPLFADENASKIGNARKDKDSTSSEAPEYNGVRKNQYSSKTSSESQEEIGTTDADDSDSFSFVSGSAESLKLADRSSGKEFPRSISSSKTPLSIYDDKPFHQISSKECTEYNSTVVDTNSNMKEKSDSNDNPDIVQSKQENKRSELYPIKTEIERYNSDHSNSAQLSTNSGKDTEGFFEDALSENPPQEKTQESPRTRGTITGFLAQASAYLNPAFDDVNVEDTKKSTGKMAKKMIISLKKSYENLKIANSRTGGQDKHFETDNEMHDNDDTVIADKSMTEGSVSSQRKENISKDGPEHHENQPIFQERQISNTSHFVDKNLIAEEHQGTKKFEYLSFKERVAKAMKASGNRNTKENADSYDNPISNSNDIMNGNQEQKKIESARNENILSQNKHAAENDLQDKTKHKQFPVPKACSFEDLLQMDAVTYMQMTPEMHGGRRMSGNKRLLPASNSVQAGHLHMLQRPNHQNKPKLINGFFPLDEREKSHLRQQAQPMMEDSMQSVPINMQHTQIQPMFNYQLQPVQDYPISAYPSPQLTSRTPPPMLSMQQLNYTRASPHSRSQPSVSSISAPRYPSHFSAARNTLSELPAPNRLTEFTGDVHFAPSKAINRNSEPLSRVLNHHRKTESGAIVTDVASPDLSPPLSASGSEQPLSARAVSPNQSPYPIWPDAAQMLNRLRANKSTPDTSMQFSMSSTSLTVPAMVRQSSVPVSPKLFPNTSTRRISEVILAQQDSVPTQPARGRTSRPPLPQLRPEWNMREPSRV